MGLGGLRSMILMLADEPALEAPIKRIGREGVALWATTPTRLLPPRVEFCLTSYRRIGISSDKQEMFRGLQHDGAGGGKAPGSPTSRVASRHWSCCRCRGASAVRVNYVSADQLSGADRGASREAGRTA